MARKKKKLVRGKCSVCKTVPLYDPKIGCHFCKCQGIMWSGPWSPFPPA